MEDWLPCLATVTSRALSLLGAFDEHHRRLTLTELAGTPGYRCRPRTGWSASWSRGARWPARPSGEYVVGRRLWDLGLLAPVQTGLRELASPYLHDLYGATLATVHLAVRDGSTVLYLDRLAGHASVPVVSSVGTRLPMHATGVGKVLLAHAPADVQQDVLADLTRVTPYTVTQPGLLRRQLAKVLRDDHATTTEEMSLGACSIAVPIRRGDGVVASLGIVVPSLKDRARLTGALHVAARGIGRALTAQNPSGSPA